MCVCGCVYKTQVSKRDAHDQISTAQFSCSSSENFARQVSEEVQ